MLRWIHLLALDRQHLWQGARTIALGTIVARPVAPCRTTRSGVPDEAHAAPRLPLHWPIGCRGVGTGRRPWLPSPTARGSTVTKEAQSPYHAQRQPRQPPQQVAARCGVGVPERLRGQPHPTGQHATANPRCYAAVGHARYPRVRDHAARVVVSAARPRRQLARTLHVRHRHAAHEVCGQFWASA